MNFTLCLNFKGYFLVDELFGCEDIYIECKSIQYRPISGCYDVYQIVRIWNTKNVFVLVYPQPLTGSKIYQNKIWQFSSKMDQKLQKYEIKVYNFPRFRLYFKSLQCKFTVLPKLAIFIYVLRHRYWQPCPKRI